MTLAELDTLLAEVARRMRLARAASAAFVPAAAAIAAFVVVALAAKLMPAERPWFVTSLAAAAGAAVAAGAFLVAWLARPVSALAAAAEVDRAAGLKERASSLVAARTGAAARTAALGALEADCARAVGGLERAGVLESMLPALPGRMRWLLALAALAAGVVLIPAREVERVDLAAVLADGGEVKQLAQAGGASDGAGGPASPAARKVLVMLKGPPPADAAGAERQKTDLEKLAAELRASGRPGDLALARKVEDLARQIGRMAGLGTGSEPGNSEPASPNAERGARADYLRNHPEYAELLSRYFGSD